jgi:tRNA 2-thiouridine synthesizing protein A
MNDGTDEIWDAGHIGCGDLVLELRMRMSRMRAGQVLRLVARDPGAPEDIPAWCRLTGHTLVTRNPPVYDIRKES